MTNIHGQINLGTPSPDATKVSPVRQLLCRSRYKALQTQFPHGFNVQLHPIDSSSRSVAEPRRVFVNSMSDLFHPEVPSDFIAKTITPSPQPRDIITRYSPSVQRLLKLSFPGIFFLTTYIHASATTISTAHVRLTSTMPYRSFRLIYGSELPSKMPNRAMQRIPVIASITTPTIRFLSIEPLIEPIADTLRGLEQYMRNIDWIIVGGESGPNARPMQDDWVRDIRDIADAMNIPFFYKQKADAHPKPTQNTRRHNARRFPDATPHTGQRNPKPSISSAAPGGARTSDCNRAWFPSHRQTIPHVITSQYADIAGRE